KIDKGTLKPGDKLESVRKMCETYGTSDITIRKSIELLKQNHYVYSKERSGVFVSGGEKQFFSLKFHEISNIIESVNGRKIMEFGNIATSDLNGYLHLSQETIRCAKIVSVGYSDAFPVFYDEKYLVNHSKMDFCNKKENKLLDTIEGVLGSYDVAKTLAIEVENGRTDIRKELLLPNRIGMFKFTKEHFTRNGQFIGLSKTYIGGDNVSLKCL
ncbi:MAG: GntR family transcriptional regulator, partial [Eubacterium sp.]